MFQKELRKGKLTDITQELHWSESNASVTLSILIRRPRIHANTLGVVLLRVVFSVSAAFAVCNIILVFQIFHCIAICTLWFIYRRSLSVVHDTFACFFRLAIRATRIVPCWPLAENRNILFCRTRYLRFVKIKFIVTNLPPNFLKFNPFVLCGFPVEIFSVSLSVVFWAIVSASNAVAFEFAPVIRSILSVIKL